MRGWRRSTTDSAGPLVAALVAALAATACQSNYYDEYLAAHPSWEAVIPREGAHLEEVLAAVHAPNEATGVEVELGDIEIFRADADLWRAIPFEAVRTGGLGSSERESYLVLVTWRCRFERGLRVGGEQRRGYYVLPANALAAWDHYTFGETCTVLDQFRAAREAALPGEREATRRLARRGNARIGLTQAYRRGLSYVGAGRFREAQAMFVFGERGFQAATSQLRAGDRAPEALVEAGRLRRALMRALDIEEE